MAVETLTGWAVKCLVGATDDPTETTFIMVCEDLPAHEDIVDAAEASGKPMFQVLSVQRSVPLVVVQDSLDQP